MLLKQKKQTASQLWSLVLVSVADHAGKDLVIRQLVTLFSLSENEAENITQQVPIILLEGLSEQSAMEIKKRFESTAVDILMTKDDNYKRKCSRVLWPQGPDLSFIETAETVRETETKREQDAGGPSEDVSPSSVAEDGRDALLAERLRFLQQENRELKAARATQAGKIAELGGSNVHLEEQLKEQLRKLQDWRTKYQAVEEQLRESSARGQALEEKLGESQREAETVKASYGGLKDDYQKLCVVKSEIEKLLEEKEALNAAPARPAEEVEDGETSKLQAQIDRQKETNEQLLRRIKFFEDFRGQAEYGLEQERMRCQVLEETLKRERDGKGLRIRELEAENAALREGYEALQKCAQASPVSQEEQERRLVALRAELDERNSAAQDRIRQLEGHVTDLTDRLVLLEDERGKAEAAWTSRVAGAEARIADYEISKARDEKTLAEQMAEIQDLNLKLHRSTEAGKDLENKFEELRSAHESLLPERQSLQKSLDERDILVGRLEAQTADLAGRVSDLQARHAEQEEVIASLERELETAEGRQAVLIERLRDLEAICRDDRGEKERLTVEVADLRRDLQTTREDLEKERAFGENREETERRFQQMVARCRDLEKSYEAEREIRGELEQACAKLSTELQEASAHRREGAEVIDKLRKERARWEEALEAKAEEVKGLAAKNELLVERIKRMESSHTEQQGMRGVWEEKIAAAHQEIKVWTSRYQEMLNSIVSERLNAGDKAVPQPYGPNDLQEKLQRMEADQSRAVGELHEKTQAVFEWKCRAETLSQELERLKASHQHLEQMLREVIQRNVEKPSPF
jgi:chromosome segregation ATPase